MGRGWVLSVFASFLSFLFFFFFCVLLFLCLPFLPVVSPVVRLSSLAPPCLFWSFLFFFLLFFGGFGAVWLAAVGGDQAVQGAGVG